MTRLEELTAKIKATAAATEQRRARDRWADSRIAQQLGCTPPQLRRARYLEATAQTDQLAAEGLDQLRIARKAGA